MAREIKFRAWSQDDEQMMIPNDEEHSSSWDWRSTAFGAPEILTGENWNADKSAILMQYTGLADKNGKEIYEGDIVGVYRCHDDQYDEDESEENYLISKHKIEYMDKWEYPAFDMNPIFCDELNSISEVSTSSYYYMVILGNIHENPELI